MGLLHLEMLITSQRPAPPKALCTTLFPEAAARPPGVLKSPQGPTSLTEASLGTVGLVFRTLTKPAHCKASWLRVRGVLEAYRGAGRGGGLTVERARRMC